MNGNLLRGLLGVLVAAVLLVATTAVLLRTPPEGTTFSAAFANPVGVFEGNPVTVLGVTVGKVTDLEPQGTYVRVTMQVREGVRLPADVRAVVLQPSLINSREIALTPQYAGGPTLDDGAHLELDRTAAPVELDEILVALQDLSTALGPEGANRDGAVNRLLRTGADTLAGQGEKLNLAVRSVADLLSMVETDRDDLTAVLRNVADVLDTLAASNGTVVGFEQSLAEATSVFAAERETFAAATAELGAALGELAAVVAEHRDTLSADVQALARVSQVLAASQRDLAEALQVLPLGLSNVHNAINPDTNRLEMRLPGDQFAPAFCYAVLNAQIPLAAELLAVLTSLPGVEQLTQQGCEQLITALMPVLGALSFLPVDEALGELLRLLDVVPLTGILGELLHQYGPPASATPPTPDLGVGALTNSGGP